MRKKLILAVDDTPENLDVLKEILTPHYSLKVAVNGVAALKIAASQIPDLILLDVMMPDMDGYEVCRRLKTNPLTAAIPVIFVTALSKSEDEAIGFDVGAVDYITKPVSPPIVLRRIDTHLSLVRTEKLNVLARSAIRMVGELGHFNDTDTGQHIWRMAAYSVAIAKEAGCSAEMLEILEMAAALHDTGKIGIPDFILKAPRKLTKEEFQIMMTHCKVGGDILGKLDNPIFQLGAEIALAHHEKWDGSGYPYGLVGENIPFSARIVAIADVYDALTMARTYKDKWSIERAFDEIKRCSGSHFDPELVECFLRAQDEILEIQEKWNPAEKDTQVNVGHSLSAKTADKITLDTAVLARLIGDEPTLINKFLLDFRDSAVKSLAQMRTAHAASEWEVIRGEAHRLKSSSRAIGAENLGECCEQVELASDSAIGEKYKEFDAALNDVFVEFDKIRT